MKLTDMFPLIVFINLDSRLDRLKESKKEFEKLGINPIRVVGKVFTGTDNPQHNAIMGCTLSHIRCLQMAKKQKCNILIFEDDIKFVNHYKAIIPNALDELDKLDWDMMYFGANILKPFNQTSNYLAKLIWAQSTHAYGVKYEFIDTLLSIIPTNQICPLDLVYTNFVVPKYNCYITAPQMVAVQRDSYSDIEGCNANYESYLERRYNENFIPMKIDNRIVIKE
jgi:GR25 family glycosyltransferase involved in LPS biosynthesis